VVLFLHFFLLFYAIWLSVALPRSALLCCWLLLLMHTAAAAYVASMHIALLDQSAVCCATNRVFRVEKFMSMGLQ